MYRKLPIVNRKNEIAVFKRLIELSDEISPSILLLRDESGRGKTRLLDLFHEHCQSKKYPIARIDFKNSSHTPLSVLRSFRIDFNYLDLKGFNNSFKKFQNSEVDIDIKGNIGIGKTDYTVIVPEKGNLNDWQNSTNALIEDLCNIDKEKIKKRVVILFDTYEMASSETKEWIYGSILPMVVPNRIDCILTVISGKEIPIQTGEWEQYCEILDLEPLTIEDWTEYAELIRSDITETQINQVYRRFREQPLKMAEFLKVLAVE